MSLSVNGISSSEIQWLILVEYHAKSGAAENRQSLKELKVTLPKSTNEQVQKVIEAVERAAQSEFIELKALNKTIAETFPKLGITPSSSSRERAISPNQEALKSP